MAVIQIDEIWENREATQDYELTRNETRTWRAFTDNSADDGTIILANGALPGMWSLHPASNGSFVIDRKAKNDPDHPRVWEVEVKYSSKFPGDKGPDQQNVNPLLKPPGYKLSWQKVRIPLLRDLDGTPILNTAGQPFNPVQEVDDTCTVITIAINKASVDLAYINGIQNGVNDDAWMGFSPWQLKVDSVTAELQYDNGVYYWALQWSIMVAPSSMGLHWHPSLVLSQGFWELYQETLRFPPVLRLCRDQYGTPLNQPALLGTDGKRLKVGDAPVVVPFRFYPLISFAGIP